jgi:release factor glutamine methyltransferase
LADALLARRGPIGLALATGRDLLTHAGCETPRLDAELLLAEVLGVGRERLVLDRHEMLSPEDWGRFEALLTRRQAREPVAYILGRRDFRYLTLRVDRRVLIPRPETELLVEVGLELAHGLSVADVGTGSGAVALALASERPDLRVVGLDVAPGALEVARANAGALGIEVEFRVADLLDDGEYDAVLANLPYVADGTELAPEIAEFEPPGALFAGVDGLDLVRRLIADAAGTRVGLLALEIGPEQADEIVALLDEHGFGSVEVRTDLAGLARVVVGRSGVVTDAGQGADPGGSS